MTASTNIGPFLRLMEDQLGRQFPFAVAKGLTQTALDAKQRLVAEMGRRFERPTPYTLNAIYIRSATKQTLEARVWVKSDAGKGTPAEKYLLPEVYGGERRLKRYERALQSARILPDGMVTVPGRAAQLDAYGNINRGQIVQLLSYFRAFGEQGYRANMTDKRRANLAKGRPAKGLRGFSYFALSQPEGKLPAGVYRKNAYSTAERASIGHLQRGAAKPVLLFVDSPQYRQTFPFFELVSEVASTNLVPNLRAAADLAEATARAPGSRRSAPAGAPSTGRAWADLIR
ncbi:hypothetical protein [Cupriavidus oxalaticus]|uniref:hypothetical protein n=1 Tax=Cupriavidus oxalaticus TaxID=96344 RepID=UPI003F7312CB